MGSLIYVSILIFLLNFIKDKLESIAEKIIEIKEEELQAKEIKESDFKKESE